jgi:uncharacterized damage-inducible protein DinB
MLADALKGQFVKAFGILEPAIRSFSDSAWRRGKPPFEGPARAASHVLQCAEFYTTEDKAVFVNLGKKIWQMSDEELPSQDQLREYLAHVKKATLAWVDMIGEEGLGRAWHNDDAMNGLERLLYALRHLQHHVGEVCAYQKQNGLEPAEWK